MDVNIKELLKVVKKAGEEILKIYNTDFEILLKEDKSPLTLADTVSNEIICDFLYKKSIYPILSEESKEIPYIERKSWNGFWCVDPLDGTKEFINRNGEFTINVAFIEHQEPILGVVYAPYKNLIFYAEKNKGSFLNTRKIEKKRTRKLEKEKLVIVASKSHFNKDTENFIKKIRNIFTYKKKIELVNKGSSLKICMIAMGEADIYPRLGPTMEWDIAAADAIVREVGKMIYVYDNKFCLCWNEDESIITVKGDPMVYNKEKLVNPYFVVV
jgi:3'(2'), 5'-bisphosphate nucleotidase